MPKLFVSLLGASHQAAFGGYPCRGLGSEALMPHWVAFASQGLWRR